MLDFHRLKMLFELKRLGTLTAVAQSMRYTHSAISQQLAICEKEVGVKLYERVGRRVRLTEQGELLADYAGRILALADEAESEILASTDSVRGRLRITSFQTALSSSLPTALTEIGQRYPELRVEIMQRDVESAIEALRTDTVDLILGEEYEADMPLTDEATHRELLIEDPIYLITPTTGPWSHLEFDDLEGVPFAIDPAELAMGKFTQQLGLRHGFRVNVEFETPDPFLHAHLVRTGHAVSLAPRLFLPLLEGLRIVEIPGKPTRTLFTAVRAGRERHPGIRAVRLALYRAAAAATEAFD
ncbi:LysR family transcriptional regulator [Corynebacterium flavescens]|uniref:LysR family transcriptional regulator n=1 Tax=Corynebacterium flavescens TaxID=28028 RepID=UPI003FCFB16E